MVRKRRNDRNHILYRLECVPTGEVYIGISAVIGQALKKTLEVRFRRHCSKARTEGKGWALHEALRVYSAPEQWSRTVLGVVRGRKAAHSLERETIKRLEPELNTF